MTQWNRRTERIGFLAVICLAFLCSCSVVRPQNGVTILDQKDKQSGATEFTVERPIENSLDALRAFRMCAVKIGFEREAVEMSSAVSQIELTDGTFHWIWKQKRGVTVFSCQKGNCIVTVATLTLPL